MYNELIQRIINAIDMQCIYAIGTENMLQYKFIPISVKDNYLFVCINSYSDKETINLKIKNYLPYQVKFIQIPDKDFENILEYISQENIETEYDSSIGTICSQMAEPIETKYKIEYISPIISVPIAIIARFIATAILGYLLFPSLIAKPLSPTIIYAYTLYPLCRYNLDIKKAYPTGWSNFFIRLFIGHIIAIPLNFIQTIGSQVQ